MSLTNKTSKYDNEIQHFPATYHAAMCKDISSLQDAIVSASESSIIGVGSGGSFTVASLLCNLHEAYTGRVSRPATPLEVICNPTLSSSSPVFVISAEGKNPDVIEATKRARRHSARSVHVVVNRNKCPLIEVVDKLSGIKIHSHDLTEKDGYLATNSLLLDALLFARAYSELNTANNNLPSEFSELRINNDQTFDDWNETAKLFVKECVARGSLTVVYSPLLKPIAVDLESKLSEAALLHTQFTDLRSYAHGRHLWLAKRPKDCAILAITEPFIHSLWENMQAHFPNEVPTLAMRLPGATPRDLIVGLIAQMYIISAIARELGCDPGKPPVPQFGRELYYLDIQKFIPNPSEEDDAAENSKSRVLGAQWPSPRNCQVMQRAKKSFVETLEKQNFKAIIFDYDGTICRSQRTNTPPPKEILKHIEQLIHSGIIIGIASGRGGSIQECLKQSLPPEILEKIYLGLYNGGEICNAVTAPKKSQEVSEFLSHTTRIIRRLQSIGVPITDIRTTHPYQVSIRFREGLSIDHMWFVIADALHQAGLDSYHIVKSKHSIDILATGVTKSRLVAHVVQKCNIDPYEILTIGDQGAWPGNDSALLEHRFSLSVDAPSRRLDRGWKIAPSHLSDVDATLWYLQCLKVYLDGTFQVCTSQTTEGENCQNA